MNGIHFLSQEDASELIKALRAEGYQVHLRPDPAPDSPTPWLLDVFPFDDAVVGLVDVCGGWMPGEAPPT